MKQFHGCWHKIQKFIGQNQMNLLLVAITIKREPLFMFHETEFLWDNLKKGLT